MFFILSFIIILAGIIITLKVLAGYNPEFSRTTKIAITAAVLFAWFAPVFGRSVRRLGFYSEVSGIVFTQAMYFIFITAFFLLCLLLIRDLFWVLGYKAAKKMGKASETCDPDNPAAIKKANIWTVAAAFLLSFYSLYEGVKFPDIKETDIVTPKISYPFKIVAVTDLHVTVATPVSRIEKIVETIRGLKPDIVVLVGDIVDDKPKKLEAQMEALSKLDARYGVFITLGNHEFYRGSVEWEKKFRDMKLFYLANEGLMLNGAGVYVAGLPDPQLLRIDDSLMGAVTGMLMRKTPGAYTVFLAHSPRFIKRLNKDLIDLQISGHTHGGQIFPFHLAVKRFNDFVSGLYDVEGMKLYISNGASGWGPPMRFLAPSEISVINLIPEKKN